MSFDVEDVMKGAECPECELVVEDYAPGVSSVVHRGQLYHPGCLPQHLCECGCGEQTVAIKQTNQKRGVRVGDYPRFIKGHSGPPPTPDAVTRFWTRVRKIDNGCWEWTAARTLGGYGSFHVTKGTYLSAHRFSWELHHGPIAEGLHVLHHCDNPPCVNPEHLFLGTAQDNADDKVKKGRQYMARHPACVPSPEGHASAVSADYAREVHDLLTTGTTQTRPATEHPLLSEAETDEMVEAFLLNVSAKEFAATLELRDIAVFEQSIDKEVASPVTS